MSRGNHPVFLTIFPGDMLEMQVKDAFRFAAFIMVTVILEVRQSINDRHVMINH